MEGRVKEIAECAICIDLFTDPRMLPCIHSFCLKCLNQTAEKTKLKQGDSMPCPLCRTPFIIPREGMVGLKKNFFLERLVEVTKLSKPSNKQIECEKCSDDSEENATEFPTATKFCINCHQNICDRCCREHKRYQELRDHQLVPLSSPVKEELLTKLALHYCSRHNKEQIKLYCFDCKQVICMMCFAVEHNSHNCSDVDTVGNTFREEITKDLKQMKILLLEVTEINQMRVMDHKNFSSLIANVEKAILKRGTELKDIVDRCTKSLLDELTSIKEQDTKQLTIEDDKANCHKTALASLEFYYNELISKGSSVEICRTINDLHQRSEDITESYSQYIQQKISPIQVCFEASKLEDFLTTKKNIVGSIKIQMKTEPEERKENDGDVTIHSSTSMDLSASSSSNVIGVAKLKDKIFVAVKNPNEILMFDGQSPFRFQKKIYASAIISPFDFASSEKSRCLYVVDKNDRSIWKMSMYDFHLIKWIHNVGEPYTLFVSAEDNVLILRWGSPVSHLEIYRSDGKLLQSLELPISVREPFHCVQKRNRDFVISHKNASTFNSMISLLSNDGKKIIRQFNQKDKSEQLGDRCYFSLDAEDNRLFVVDTRNQRVILLDSNSLQLKQFILTKEDGISLPLGLFWDSNRKHLGVQFRHQVVVYEVE